MRGAVTYTNNKVKVRQVGINVRQTVVEDEDVKYTIQIQEEETVGETVVQSQEDDDGLGDHNAQGHGGHEAHLLDDINLLLGDGHLMRVFRIVLLDSARNDNTGQRLGQEAHAKGERYADNHIDPKDPRQAHVDIVGDPLADGRAQRGAGVGRGDEQGHRLACAIRVAKQVGDGAGNVTQGDTAGCSAEKLEDDQHGQVERLGAADVQEGVDEDGDDIDPFAPTNITASILLAFLPFSLNFDVTIQT